LFINFELQLEFIQLHGFGKQSADPYVIMSNDTRESPTSDKATLN